MLPYTYIPSSRWRTCIDCDVVWASISESACWSCAGPGVRTHEPRITSQHDFGWQGTTQPA